MTKQAQADKPARFKVRFLRGTTNLEWPTPYNAGDEKIVDQDELERWQARDAVELLEEVDPDTELTNDADKAAAAKARADEIKAKIDADKAEAKAAEAKAKAEAKAAEAEAEPEAKNERHDTRRR